METKRWELPTQASECKDLQEWMELVLGLTQQQVATLAGVQQSRVSAVFRGALPRRKLWAPLLRALRLEHQEHQFYRMVMSARAVNERIAAAEKALKTPIQHSEPLMAAAPGEQQNKIIEHRIIGEESVCG